MQPPRSAAQRLLDWRRVLVYTHRWLGIFGCVVFVVWFASGIVMMYARMPALDRGDRLARLPVLDLSAATLSPAEAARRAGAIAERLRLGTYEGRAVYRFFGRGRWTTVSAESGAVLEPLTAEAAVRAAQRFVPEFATRIRYETRLNDADQWTFSVRGLMPMHRLGIGDGAGTRLYISDQTGEPAMKTSASQRRWGFLGAVLHWFYFAPLRRHSWWWAQSVIWSAVAGCVLCLTGLFWGVWRYSPRRSYRLKRVRSHTPYAGLMSWHHYAGLAFGLASFTWILSGLLSMSPWGWNADTTPTPRQREAVQGGALRIESIALRDLREALRVVRESFPVKEIEVVQLAGQPFALAYRSDPFEQAARRDSPYFVEAPPPEQRLVSLDEPEQGDFLRFADDAMLAAGLAAMPGFAVESAEWLRAYDAYYYDRHGSRSLPVLRMRFRDPRSTWLYLDPHRGVIALKHDRPSRLNRWLYHGLHSLDFPFLYYRRPLWDVVVIALSVGGIAVSLTTLGQVWHRMRRHARRLGLNRRGATVGQSLTNELEAGPR